MSPGALLLIATVALGGSILAAIRFARTSLVLTVTGGVAGLASGILVLAGAPVWEWYPAVSLGGEPLHLRLDALSAFFLSLVSVIGTAGAVYGREYWSQALYPASAARGRAWWSGLMLGMGWVLVSANGLHFLMGWELFTLCAFFLVTLDRQQRAARSAGWLYLAASHAGTVCLFGFFGTLAAHTGSWDLMPMRNQPQFAFLFWLILPGFGIKAGVFPLHVWLPSAHANAPSHVSAMLSGAAIKMGIYGLLRFSGWIAMPAAAGWVLLAIGAASALFGIVFAFAQNDLKRLLAYCSVENVGIILTGVGVALLGLQHGDAAWGKMAMAGALLHIWNHAAFKALLFFGAGSILHATGTREMSRLGGLWRLMPWTASLFGLGALAVSGLPPLNGFVSEWLVYLGLFTGATDRTAPVALLLLATIAFSVTGAFALACFVKAVSIVFLGSPRTQQAANAHECGVLMRGSMLFLGGVCVAVAMVPVLLWPAVARAMADWNPSWAGAEIQRPLATLGVMQTALATLEVLAAVLLWRKSVSRGVRRALTWDCGYARPTARMQYSSGSFSAIATSWFTWLLRPERNSQRPRGAFPRRAMYVEIIPDTVLERVLTPVRQMVEGLSAVARRLQHGRLQSYILYLLAGLLAMVALVLFGGRP